MFKNVKAEHVNIFFTNYKKFVQYTINRASDLQLQWWKQHSCIYTWTQFSCCCVKYLQNFTEIDTILQWPTDTCYKVIKRHIKVLCVITTLANMQFSQNNF